MKFQSEPSYEYGYRRRLSAIIGEAELLNHELKGPVTAEQKEALETIIAESYELSGMLSASRKQTETLTRLKQLEGEEASVLIISKSSFFDSVTEGQENLGSTDMDVVQTFDTALANLNREQYDRVIVDAIVDGRIGVECILDLIDETGEPLRFGLVSIINSPTGEPRLGLSGVLSSGINEDVLSTALQESVPNSINMDGAVVGTLGKMGPLTNRIEAIGADQVSLAGEDVTKTDLVIVDLPTVADLSKEEFARLRGFYQESSRPLLVLAPESQSYPSVGWVPTIGYDRYVYRPPNSIGIVGEILLSHSMDRPWEIDGQTLLE